MLKTHTVAGAVALGLTLVFPIFLVFPFLPAHVAAALAMTVVGFVAFQQRANPREILRALIPGWPVYAFFTLAIVSMVWATYPMESLYRGAVNALFFGPFLGLSLLGLRGGWWWVYAAGVGVPLICLSIFSVFLVSYGTVRTNEVQLKEILQSFANLFPAICILFVPFQIEGWVSRSASKSWMAIGFLAAVTVCTLSGSRAITLLLVPAIVLPIVFFTTPVGRLHRRKGISVAASALGTALVVMVLVGAIVGSEQTMIGTTDRLASGETWRDPALQLDEPRAWTGDCARAPSNMTTRKLQYKEGLKVIQEHPLLGIGFENLRPRIANKICPQRAVGSHNILITAWGEMGLPGLALLITIVTVAFAGWWRNRLDGFHSAAFAAFLIATVHAQVRPQLSNIVMYVVLAVLLSGYHFRTQRGSVLNVLTSAR